MKKNAIPDFIVIDDDDINNIICDRILQMTFPGVSVQTFIDPELGLEYIQAEYSKGDANNAVLFLDINMPVLSGWDVLDRLGHFSRFVTAHIKIFMLSSSIDPQDKKRAIRNPLVSNYMSKSLSHDKLKRLFPDIIM